MVTPLPKLPEQSGGDFVVPPDAKLAEVIHQPVSFDTPTDVEPVAPPTVVSQRVKLQAIYAKLKSENALDRIQGCNALKPIGRPDHIQQLEPLLQDADADVCVAATRAISTCGPWVDPEPLEELLITGDLPRQLAAMVALSELGSPIGPAAIEQLSYSPNPEFRAAAAQAAAELVDPLFTDMLIRLLNDPTVARAASLRALPICVGVEVAAPTDSAHVAAEKWRAWYKGGGRTN